MYSFSRRRHRRRHRRAVAARRAGALHLRDRPRRPQATARPARHQVRPARAARRQRALGQQDHAPQVRDRGRPARRRSPRPTPRPWPAAAPTGPTAPAPGTTRTPCSCAATPSSPCACSRSSTTCGSTPATSMADATLPFELLEPSTSPTPTSGRRRSGRRRVLHLRQLLGPRRHLHRHRRDTVADQLVEAIKGATDSIHIASGHLRLARSGRGHHGQGPGRARPRHPGLPRQPGVHHASSTENEQVSRPRGLPRAAGHDVQAAPLPRQGLPVRLRGRRRRASTSATSTTPTAGTTPTPSQMHHKYMVIDGDELWTGSFNLSDNAEHNTMENMLDFRGPGLAPTSSAAYEGNFPPSGTPAATRTCSPSCARRSRPPTSSPSCSTRWP